MGGEKGAGGAGEGERRGGWQERGSGKGDEEREGGMVGGWVARGQCYVGAVCDRLELINAFTCRMLQAFATKTSHAASL